MADSGAPEKAQNVDPLYLWKTIILLLQNLHQMRKASDENLASIHRLHTKILKNPTQSNPLLYILEMGIY